MHGQRRFRRYKVGPEFPLSVIIPQSFSRSYRLQTIGEGGVGFYASSREAHLARQDVIDLKFSLGGKILALKGRVKYCTFVPQTGSNFLGIKFENLDARQDLFIKAIIQAAFKRGHLVDISDPQSS